MRKTKVTIYTKENGDCYYFFVKDDVLYGHIRRSDTDRLYVGLGGINKCLDEDSNVQEEIENIISKTDYVFYDNVLIDIECYYPRIAWTGYDYKYRDDKHAIQFFEAGRMLMSKLHKLTYTVNPSPINDLSYGHEMRALLLLICMEVENNFVSILKENDYIKDRYTTGDFIKLKDLMNLSDFEVEFIYFSEYPPIKPFSGWDDSTSTQSLTWYDAYNKTKHNREESFEYGNLHNVLHSMAALIVLLYAQYHTFPYDNEVFKMNGIKVIFPKLKPEQVYLELKNGNALLNKKRYFS